LQRRVLISTDVPLALRPIGYAMGADRKDIIKDISESIGNKILPTIYLAPLALLRIAN
jgi:hypothetical protein